MHLINCQIANPENKWMEFIGFFPFCWNTTKTPIACFESNFLSGAD